MFCFYLLLIPAKFLAPNNKFFLFWLLKFDAWRLFEILYFKS